MVRASRQALAQIGRLHSPPAEALGTNQQAQARKLFRDACRMLPWAINNFKLQEIANVVSLRRQVNDQFKQYMHMKDPKAIDVLLYKGREEIECIFLQHKQRHHLIQQYIVDPSKKDAAAFGRLSKQTTSPFLEGFLTNHGYAR